MASETKRAEVVERGLSIRAIVIGAALTVAWVIWQTLGRMTIIFNQPNAFVYPLGWFFPLLVVIALINQKVKFRGAELAVMFTMIFWAMYGYQFGSREVPTSFLYGGQFGWKGVLEQTRPWVASIIPSYWGNAWFWVAGSIIFTYMMIFYQYIWRRQIQEIERLPFPMSQIPISLMQATVARTERGHSAIFENQMFWTGMIVAAVWMIPSIVSSTASLLKIPSPIKMGYGTGWNEPKDTEAAIGVGGQAFTIDLTPVLYSVIPNADPRFIIGLAHISIGYFLPTDVAISVTIAWLLFWWIIPPIQVAMGSFTALSKPGTMAYWGWSYINLSDPKGLMCQYSVVLAVPFALGLMPLILHRRYFIETIRAAIKGTKIGIEGWQDPYRLYWLGFLICLLLSIGWGIAFGASIIGILVTLAATFFMFGGLIRVGGEGWAHPVSWFTFSDVPLSITNPNYFSQGFADRNLTNLATSIYGARFHDWNNFGIWAHPGGWGDGIATMKIGQELHGRLKDILIATGISIILGSIVSVLTAYWYNSMYPFRYGQTSTLSNWGSVETAPVLDTRQKQWTAFAIGVVVWSIVQILRMRFAWFILNPVGFMLPWTVHFFSVNCFGITLAWVIKLVALRIGGPKLVDKLLWFFIGAMTGLAIISVYTFAAGSLGPILGWGNPRCVCGP